MKMERLCYQNSGMFYSKSHIHNHCGQLKSIAVVLNWPKHALFSFSQLKLIPKLKIKLQYKILITCPKTIESKLSSLWTYFDRVLSRLIRKYLMNIMVQHWNWFYDKVNWLWDVRYYFYFFFAQSFCSSKQFIKHLFHDKAAILPI